MIADLKLSISANGTTQCFPFYTYNVDGTNRRENITDDALAKFQAHYGEGVSKWDVFGYLYALLHHDEYRAYYRENLKRELPRIPFVGDADTFGTLAFAGSQLLALHTGYETAAEYPLTDEYEQTATLSEIYHVSKMRLSKDGTAIHINSHLTLRGIPPEAHRYKLGSRSALEWIIDQYRVRGDSDPNRADDPEYIVRLVRRIVTVSVQSVELLADLPTLDLAPLETL